MEPRTQGDGGQGPPGDGAPGMALRAVLATPGARCPHCGYSLEGLSCGSDGAICPECGGGLEAGLVGAAGPRTVRRLMVLMFAWLAFAGLMNTTRQCLAIYDWHLAPAAGGPFGAAGGWPRGYGGGWSSVPWWSWALTAGWLALGAIGVTGAVAASIMGPGRKGPERLLLRLLVLGFLVYWGYHAVVFAMELASR